jgi:hypothetical protein
MGQLHQIAPVSIHNVNFPVAIPIRLEGNFARNTFKPGGFRDSLERFVLSRLFRWFFLAGL